MAVELLAELPRHPSEQEHGPESRVLPAAVAELVLEELRLPPDADASGTYVGQAYSARGGRREQQPFVRVVWFTSNAADNATGAPKGTHEDATRALYGDWCEAQTCVGGMGKSGGGVQGATGTHTELGMGVLPGKRGGFPWPLAGSVAVCLSAGILGLAIVWRGHWGT